MAAAAKERGYEYLAITDHSRHVTIAHGLDASRLAQQIDEIDRVNETLAGIALLKGTEVDILADGRLDLSNSILSRLDIVVAAVHYKFDLSRKAQTERIIRAMDNPHVNIIAHPTGRLLGKREPHKVDMERLIAAAKERNCCLEITPSPADSTSTTCMPTRQRQPASSLLSRPTHTRRTSLATCAMASIRRDVPGSKQATSSTRARSPSSRSS